MRPRVFKFFTRRIPGEISLFFYFPSLFFYYFHFVHKDIVVDYDFLINARLQPRAMNRPMGLARHGSLVQRDF